MPGRLGPRFALETAFLLLLAVAMGLAELSATAIVVVMAVAWALVAAVEWFASRQPTYPVVPGRPWSPPAPTAEPLAEEEEADTDARGLAVDEGVSAKRRRWRRRARQGTDGEEKSRADR